MTFSVTARRLVVGGALVAAGGLGLPAAFHAAGPAPAQEPAAKGKTAGPIPFGKPGEHPMFGGSPDRNMVNLTGKFAPTVLAKLSEDGKLVVADGAAIKWHADLGSR